MSPFCGAVNGTNRHRFAYLRSLLRARRTLATESGPVGAAVRSVELRPARCSHADVASLFRAVRARDAGWVLLAAGLLGGCAEEVTLTTSDAPEVDVVLLAARGADGEPTTQLLRIAGGAQRVRVNVGSRVIAFGVSSRDLVDEVGRPLGEDDLLGTLASQPPRGSCGRCLVSGARTAPLLLHPGSACPPPAFARVWTAREGQDRLLRVDGTDAEVEEVRAVVRLERRGPCAHEPHPLPELEVPPRVETLFPAADGDGVDLTLQAPDGALSLFQNRRVLEIDPSGNRTRVEVPALEGVAVDGVVLADRSSLFLHHTAAAPGTTAELVRLAHTGDQRLVPGFFAERGGLVLVPPSLAPQLDARPSPAGLVLAAGGRQDVFTNMSPALLACAVGSSVDCIDLPAPRWPSNATGLLRPVLFADGAFMAFLRSPLGAHGSVVYGAREAGRWSFEVTAAINEGESAFVAIAAGQRAAVCLDDSRRVATATVVRADLLQGLVPSWRIAEVPFCENLAPDPRAPGRVLITGGDFSHVIELDLETLEWTERDTLEVFRVPYLLRLRETSPGRFLATDKLGIWRGVPGVEDVLTLERSFGPDPALQLVDAPTAVAATLEGWTAVASQTRYDVRLEADGRTSVSTVALDRTLGVVHAVASEDGGSLLVSGERFDEAAGLWRVRGSRVEALALPDEISRGPLALLALRPWTAGSALVAGEGFALFRLEGDSLTSISIAWDDPETPELETRPDPSLPCPPTFVGPGGTRPGWRGVDVSGGVAWLVGCHGVIARLVAGSTEAVRFGVARLETRAAGDDLLAPDFSAVRALAPDHAVISAPGREETTRSGRLFELLPDGYGLRLREIDSSDVGGDSPLRLVGEADALVEIGASGVVRGLGARGTTRVAGREMILSIVDAAARGDDFVMVGEGPRIFLGRTSR